MAWECSNTFNSFIKIKNFISGIELDGPISEEQFLSLEPPPLEDDYLFSLGPDEGLTDLFDFSFDDDDLKKTKNWWSVRDIQIVTVYYSNNNNNNISN